MPIWVGVYPVLARAFRLDDGSRMSGDVHVRFCESLGVKFPRATYPCGEPGAIHCADRGSGSRAAVNRLIASAITQDTACL